MKDSSAAIHAQVPVDVATFLLNEKRSDIHLIESRLKVSITLIPNPHMETPHYSVNRLRQDDITSDHLQASYKLVEKPEEVKAVKAASPEEVKAQRPQAAVKGITPAQPAPKHEIKKVASTSLFGKLFGWLFGSSEKSKPVAAPAKARPQNPRRERDSNRGERPEGAQPQGNSRQRNKPRRDREDANAPRAENAQQPKAQQQEARAERPPRPPRAANVEKPVLETAKAVAPSEQSGEEGSNQGRKRGRRGGRRERERRDLLAATEPNGNEIALNGSATTEISGDMTAVTETVSTPVVSEAPVTPVEPALVEAAVTSETVTPPPTIVAQEIVAQPIVTIPVAEVVPVAVAAPAPASLVVPSLSEAGLVMIETDPNKAATVTPVPESREHAPRRRQRPREIYTLENSEPLVMIETQQSK